MAENIDRQIALDDLIHDAFAEKASRINNEGEEAQIAFLKSEGWTEEQIEEEIGETVNTIEKARDDEEED